MIGPANGVRIWLACGLTDMRRGMDSLAAQVQQQLAADPFSGQVADMNEAIWQQSINQ
jgi:transposase